MNILVVDDEPLIAEGICFIIHKMDIDCDIVEFALSGEDALRKMEEHSFDFCFSDISMPNMDGLQFIQICKDRHLCKNYCIISGYADFEYARQAIRLEVKDYILKPVDEHAIFEMLQRFDLSNKIKTSMKTADNPYVSEMLQLISEEFMHDIKLRDVANRININPEYAGKLFRSHTSLSFSEYQNRYKLNQIINKIKADRTMNFEQLAMENGFSEIRTFYRVFKKIFNMTPGEYREKFLDEY